jgi:hypothetical protein
MVAGFDTLRAARQLKQAGLAEPAAEAIAEVLRESREFDLSQLATKTDLDNGLGKLRSELIAEIERGKTDILKWVAGLLVAQGAAIVTLVRLLGHG